VDTWEIELANQGISYATINEALFESFPSLKARCVREVIGFDYEKELPPPYVVFGDIFRKYLLECQELDAKCQNEIAQFIERMATSGDPKVEDILVIEILSALLETQETIDSYWSYLGPSTRRLLRQNYLRMSPELHLPGTE
jgi:hypothetical protein